MSKNISLELVGREFSICKLENCSQIDFEDEFCFVGKTDEEYSLVCSSSRVPCNCTVCDPGWRAFRIEGTLDFSLVGILAQLTAVLAGSGIGLFAVSTYNTDYVLVREENLSQAAEALERAGYRFPLNGWQSK